RVIDLSENSELNDLLFVTDILITDYSSAVFEASLLDIPMVMYAYDLSEYTATRDFYYEYKPGLPGKLAQTQDEVIEAIKNNDFETERIKPFKEKFFDHFDGKSTERVVEMIKELL
ncbi:MAG: CDP-glycerol glycerophosphotransferase family protein, partial [Clostridia bacterium]|nr:CDP-glycerol glycerophosphotransferase family protein [Clostridia bacterium]